MSKKILKLSLILGMVALFSTACSWPWQKKAAPTNPNSPQAPAPVVQATSTEIKYSGDLKKFVSSNDLASFMNANLPSSALGGRSEASSCLSSDLNSPLFLEDADILASDNSASGAKFAEANSNGWVSGAEKPDIIKHADLSLYALVRNDLFIIKTLPVAEAGVISRINFKDRPSGLILSGNNLVVFGNDKQTATIAKNQFTYIKVFDVSNPANPVLVRDLSFEGRPHSTRLIGDYLYFISESAPSISSDSIGPRVFSAGRALSFTPDVFYFDIPYSSWSYTSINAISLLDNNEALTGQVYLLDDTQKIYFAGNSILISYSGPSIQYDLEQAAKREVVGPKLSAADQDKIAKIEAAPNFLLFQNEKKIKISLVIDNYLAALNATDNQALQAAITVTLNQKLTGMKLGANKTTLYKIAASGNKFEYRAKGEVAGRILGQPAADETGATLRLATANSLDGQTETNEKFYTNIYILDANLQAVGRLENLESQAEIKAARWFPGRAFLTSATADGPIYTINLSDPTKPQVVGAAALPYAFNYLYPLDKEGLKFLSFNSAASSSDVQSGHPLGAQISLLDFTDLKAPKELDAYQIGGADSDSIAFSDHQAVSYSEVSGVAIIPAAIKREGALSFVGAFAFSIGSDSLSLKGEVNHLGASTALSDSWGGYDYYDNTVKRGFMSGGQVFTFSNHFLKINEISGLEPIKSLVLTPGANDYTISPAAAVSGATSSPDSNVSASDTLDAPSPTDVLLDASGSPMIPPDLGGS